MDFCLINHFNGIFGIFLTDGVTQPFKLADVYSFVKSNQPDKVLLSDGKEEKEEKTTKKTRDIGFQVELPINPGIVFVYK